MGLIDTGRSRVAYELDGPPAVPVLVLSGSLGRSMSVWDEALPALVARHRVLCYDYPGHGASPPADAPVDVADLGVDLLALLDALGIEEASLCGLPLGDGGDLGGGGGARARREARPRRHRASPSGPRPRGASGRRRCAGSVPALSSTRFSGAGSAWCRSPPGPSSGTRRRPTSAPATTSRTCSCARRSGGPTSPRSWRRSRRRRSSSAAPRSRRPAAGRRRAGRRHRRVVARRDGRRLPPPPGRAAGALLRGARRPPPRPAVGSRARCPPGGARRRPRRPGAGRRHPGYAPFQGFWPGSPGARSGPAPGSSPAPGAASPSRC